MKTDTRESIIETSFNLLLHKGYDGVSITDIQHEVGISRGLLYHYFKNKEELFMEVAKSKFASIFSINLSIVEGMDIDQMTLYIVELYRKFVDEILQGLPIINYDFLFYRMMQQSHELTEIYQQTRRTEQRAWQSAIENSIRKGLVNKSVSPQQMAQQFIYITDGVWMRAVIPDVGMEMIKTLEEALNIQKSLIKTVSSLLEK